MNEYLIHPIVFYLLGLINKVHVFCFMALLSSSAFLFIFASEIMQDYASERLVRAYSIAKKVAVVAILLLLFMPAETTAYKMMIASYITKENIHNAVEVVDKAVDKLFIQLKEERQHESKH